MQRHRHRKQLYLASLVATVIGVVLYETQWFNLRPGLFVLLAGQVGDVVALLTRNFQLSNDMDRAGSGVANELAITTWFEGEELFIRRLAVFDAACQMTGFLILGYAFWLSTRNLWLALGIGFVYPVTLYVGVQRRKNLDAIRQLTAQKQEIMLHEDCGDLR